MELNRTPVSYQQAANMLRVSLETVKKAVQRGVLTKLPREGLYQHLMEGQVMLFKDKMLSLSVLNESERKLWQAHADSVNNPHTPASQEIPASNQIMITNNPEIQKATAMLQRVGQAVSSPAGSGVPQGQNFMVALLIPM